jgi:hypothetical protein
MQKQGFSTEMKKTEMKQKALTLGDLAPAELCHNPLTCFERNDSVLLEEAIAEKPIELETHLVAAEPIAIHFH